MSPHAAPGPWRYVLEAVLLWMGLGTVLLFLTGVVDTDWFVDSPEGRRSVARTVLVFTVATLVTGGFLLWRTVPSLRRTLAHERPAHTSSTLAQHSLYRWLISLRWVALLILAPVVVVSTISGLVPETSALPLWVGVAALFLANTLLALVNTHLRVVPAVFVAQVAFDGMLLAWLVHHAGGMANPFAGLFAFHAVIAGIVLRPRVAHGVLAGLVLLVLAVTLVEAGGLWQPACVSGFDGACRHPDALHLLAAGLGVAILVGGCGWFVVALMGAVRAERDRLAGARLELFHERGKLRSMIDCMADAVVFADRDGRIGLLNHAALSLWPAGPPESRDLRVCHNDETWQRLLHKLADPGANESHPMLVVGDRSYEPTYARVLDGDQNLLGVVMVARDVTDRLAAQSWRMREERMAVVGKLAAALAHELNNPLATIALFAQHALKKVSDDNPLAEHLQTVLRNANLCSKHVQDLLRHARQRRPEHAAFNPTTLLAEVEKTLVPHADRVGVRVVVRPEPNVPEVLVADPDQLRQVLVNLGMNGIDAMPRGGVLNLRVRSAGPEEICFEVQDDGTGIPKEALEEIFTPFHTTKPEGTGLGLAVASDIVRHHNGRLAVDSQVGRGSVFRVWLPLGSPVAQEAVA
jgi:signal transduction histidine kinase